MRPDLHSRRSRAWAAAVAITAVFLLCRSKQGNDVSANAEASAPRHSTASHRVEHRAQSKVLGDARSRHSSPRPRLQNLDTEPTDAPSLTGAVRGEVETPTGEPASLRFVVALDSQTGQRHRTVSLADGSFAITDLRPGEYQLWALAPGAARLRAIHQPDTYETVAVAAGEESWALVTVPEREPTTSPSPGERPAIIRGRVLADDTGEGIRGAMVLAGPDREGAWGFSAAVETDPEGYFVPRSLPLERIRLVVHPPQTRTGASPHQSRVLALESPSADVHELDPIRLPARE